MGRRLRGQGTDTETTSHPRRKDKKAPAKPQDEPNVPMSSAAAGSGAAAERELSRAAGFPESLTRERCHTAMGTDKAHLQPLTFCLHRRLKEIMIFNAESLQEELHPTKEERARWVRGLDNQPQIDPEALKPLQMRIAQQVQARVGVSDEEVMAAVDAYDAKSDPMFKEILQRIANTFNSALGREEGSAVRPEEGGQRVGQAAGVALQPRADERQHQDG